jgi:hypothetical protein
MLQRTTVKIPCNIQRRVVLHYSEALGDFLSTRPISIATVLLYHEMTSIVIEFGLSYIYTDHSLLISSYIKYRFLDYCGILVEAVAGNTPDIRGSVIRDIKKELI